MTQSLQLKGVLSFRTIQRRQIDPCVKEQPGVRGAGFNQIPADLLCTVTYIFASSALCRMVRCAFVCGNATHKISQNR